MVVEEYHKLVKTTPNPSATKRSSGELVGPPFPPLPCVGDAVAAVELAVLVAPDIVALCHVAGLRVMICDVSGMKVYPSNG